MAYEKTTWSRGDVVTSAKLNKIENELYYESVRKTLPEGSTDKVGYVLKRTKLDPFESRWGSLKEYIEISAQESAQLLAIVDQLKTAADSAETKTAAMGIPFPNGGATVESVFSYMNSNGVVPVGKMVGATEDASKYMAIYDASSTVASFGYSDIGSNAVYEVRFFINKTSLIIRVTSCPFSIVGA